VLWKEGWWAAQKRDEVGKLAERRIEDGLGRTGCIPRQVCSTRQPWSGMVVPDKLDVLSKLQE
jgi:hypothetical protein